MEEYKIGIEVPNLSTLFSIGRTRLDIFDFIKQIDQVYPGLGIPTLYGVLSILANKSVFYIGGRGVGKTRVINLIPPIEGTIEKKMDTFTLSQLDKWDIENEHLVFKVEDLSSTSTYHRETFLRVFCKIISDGSFTHYSKGPSGISICITNCKLTVIAAVQPLIYSNLCNRFSEWESMSYDRFSKFILLNPLRKDTLDIPFTPTLPRNITPREEVTSNWNELDLSKIEEMYSKQISIGRKTLYARDYVVAMAMFDGTDRVKQEHVDLFYQLFHPYLESFNVLQHAADLDSSVKVSAGKMKLLTEIARSNDAVDKKVLAKNLYVSEREIERCAKELIKAGLIEKANSPSPPRKAEYRLSPSIRNYFQWYKDKIGLF